MNMVGGEFFQLLTYTRPGVISHTLTLFVLLLGDKFGFSLLLLLPLSSYPSLPFVGQEALHTFLSLPFPFPSICCAFQNSETQAA